MSESREKVKRKTRPRSLFAVRFSILFLLILFRARSRV